MRARAPQLSGVVSLVWCILSSASTVTPNVDDDYQLDEPTTSEQSVLKTEPSRYRETFVSGDLRIIGGEPASNNQFPYQVSLSISGYHVCGGSILTPTIVLTAAHCVHGQELSDLTVAAGGISLDSLPHSRAVTKVVLHEEYSVMTLANDIALLELSSKLPLDGITLEEISLRAVPVIQGCNCTVSGWGITSVESSIISSDLNYVDVPVTSCDPYGQMVEPGMICAGYLEGGKDSCSGDSGGPLVCDGVLTGAVSWGTKCAEADSPGVYTDIHYFRTWIEQNSGDSSVFSTPDMDLTSSSSSEQCRAGGYSCSGASSQPGNVVASLRYDVIFFFSIVSCWGLRLFRGLQST